MFSSKYLIESKMKVSSFIIQCFSNDKGTKLKKLVHSLKIMTKKKELFEVDFSECSIIYVLNIEYFHYDFNALRNKCISFIDIIIAKLSINDNDKNNYV